MPDIANCGSDPNVPAFTLACVLTRAYIVCLFICLFDRVCGCLGLQLHWTLLHCAAAYGRTALVEPLVTRGARLEASSSAGRTPLQLACRSDQRDTALLLARLGANPNTMDRDVSEQWRKGAGLILSPFLWCNCGGDSCPCVAGPFCFVLGAAAVGKGRCR